MSDLVKTEGGILVPEEMIRRREVWTYDDGKRLRKMTKHAAKAHNIGMALVCLRCLEAGRQATLIWGGYSSAGRALAWIS